MSLAGYLPETRAISWKTGDTVWSIQARGLSLPDLTTLVSDRLGELDEAIVLWADAKVSVFTPIAMQKFLQNLLRKAPGLVGQILALSSDEPELSLVYERAPFAKQLEALAAIFELTLKEVGGLKNLQATLAEAVPSDVLESLRAEVRSMTPSSTTGGFEKTLASFSQKDT